MLKRLLAILDAVLQARAWWNGVRGTPYRLALAFKIGTCTVCGGKFSLIETRIRVKLGKDHRYVGQCPECYR